jgi:alpha-N-acetylglucosamine transferase
VPEYKGKPLKRHRIGRVPENCAHTRANLTTPISPGSFSVRTHHLLNGGLIVLHPSQEAFERLTEVLADPELVSTFLFPDQDLLAHVYKNKFQPLGYQYNALKTLRACHTGMWRDEDVKNVHYILDKPWSKRVEKGDANEVLHGWWWDEFGRVEAEWKGTKDSWEVVKRNTAPQIQN